MITKNPAKPKATDNWGTPDLISLIVRRIMIKINLDPCAEPGKRIFADKHFTVEDNGLSKRWSGKVYMNPPYSKPSAWIEKLCTELKLGCVTEAIALIPTSTDTKWFDLIWETCSGICFWKGRIKFLDIADCYKEKLPARSAHCLVYWGKNFGVFEEETQPYGKVIALDTKESYKCKVFKNPVNFSYPIRQLLSDLDCCNGDPNSDLIDGRDIEWQRFGSFDIMFDRGEKGFVPNEKSLIKSVSDEMSNFSESTITNYSSCNVVHLQVKWKETGDHISKYKP